MGLWGKGRHCEEFLVCQLYLTVENTNIQCEVNFRETGLLYSLSFWSQFSNTSISDSCSVQPIFSPPSFCTGINYVCMLHILRYLTLQIFHFSWNCAVKVSSLFFSIHLFHTVQKSSELYDLQWQDVIKSLHAWGMAWYSRVEWWVIQIFFLVHD